MARGRGAATRYEAMPAHANEEEDTASEQRIGKGRERKRRRRRKRGRACGWDEIQAREGGGDQLLRQHREGKVGKEEEEERGRW